MQSEIWGNISSVDPIKFPLDGWWFAAQYLPPGIAYNFCRFLLNFFFCCLLAYCFTFQASLESIYEWVQNNFLSKYVYKCIYVCINICNFAHILSSSLLTDMYEWMCINWPSWFFFFISRWKDSELFCYGLHTHTTHIHLNIFSRISMCLYLHIHIYIQLIINIFFITFHLLECHLHKLSFSLLWMCAWPDLRFSFSAWLQNAPIFNFILPFIL